jgi:hypothetical protein
MNSLPANRLAKHFLFSDCSASLDGLTDQVKFHCRYDLNMAVLEELSVRQKNSDSVHVLVDV